MGVEDIINGREWDVLLPSQCRGCGEVNAELNASQGLLNRAVGKTAANKACNRLIEYVEANCPGLTDPNDLSSCPSWPRIKLTNFIELPPAPTDIVDG